MSNNKTFGSNHFHRSMTTLLTEATGQLAAYLEKILPPLSMKIGGNKSFLITSRSRNGAELNNKETSIRFVWSHFSDI